MNVSCINISAISGVLFGFYGVSAHTANKLNLTHHVRLGGIILLTLIITPNFQNITSKLYITDTENKQW